MKRYFYLACAWISCIVGFVGIFVPVLPTTPLLLLATFLFARSSPRAHAWIQSTRAYQTYVVAFKEAGGIPVGVKVRMLTVSFALMGISAFFVQLWYVWLALAAVGVFLLYLMCVRIPTIDIERFHALRSQKEAD